MANFLCFIAASALPWQSLLRSLRYACGYEINYGKRGVTCIILTALDSRNSRKSYSGVVWGRKKFESQVSRDSLTSIQSNNTWAVTASSWPSKITSKLVADKMISTIRCTHQWQIYKKKTKTAEPIEIPYGVATRVGQKNYIRWGSRSHHGRENFSGGVHSTGKHYNSQLRNNAWTLTFEQYKEGKLLASAIYRCIYKKSAIWNNGFTKQAANDRMWSLTCS